MGADGLRPMLPKFARLERACFAQPWTEQVLSDAYDTGLYVFSYVTAEPDGAPVGYACGMLSVGDCEVERVCVLPEFRRRGYARRLMNELRTVFEAIGAERVFLEVRAANAPARALYEQLGYRLVGTRKNYYGDDDAALYTLELC